MTAPTVDTEIVSTRDVPNFRPSKLGLACLCPASVHMGLMYPEGEPGEYAAEGTLLHEVVAGKREKDGLEDEQLKVVEACEKYILARSDGCAEIIQEREFTVDFGDFRLVAHPDAVIVLEGGRGKKARVIDFKMGYNPVPEASMVFQLYAYALAVGYAEVEVFLYQPRTGTERTAKLTRKEDFEETREDIRNLYEKSVAGTSMVFHPSHEACVGCYCPALKFCPAARALVKTIPEKVKLEMRAVDTFTLVDAINKLDILEDIKTDARRELKARILAGDQIHGWGLQKRAGGRVVKDIAGAYKALVVPGDIAEAEFIGALKGIDLKALEAAGGGREQVEAALGSLIEHKPEVVALVRKEK
jgi:hypothetical protein